MESRSDKYSKVPKAWTNLSDREGFAGTVGVILLQRTRCPLQPARGLFVEVIFNIGVPSFASHQAAGGMTSRSAME